jgi:hypothetical protein
MYDPDDADYRRARRCVAGLTPVRAELAGSDRCSALGNEVNSTSSVLAICRQLIEAGHDPQTPLEVYRGDVLCLSVRSIGEGAELEVNSKGNGFSRRSAVRTARPRNLRIGPLSDHSGIAAR